MAGRTQPWRRGRRRGKGSARVGLIMIAVALGLGALGRTGWLPPELTDAVQLLRFDLGPDAAGPAVGTPSGPVDLAQAAADLQRIRIEPEHRAGYDRDAWPHWLDEDGDCLDAREEVLAAESLTEARLYADGCSVLSGPWRDLYTGETVADPSDLDVDDLVPLQEAHDSGGREWSRGQRASYANDLDDPRTLIAVSAAASRAKGSQGPEEWLPPDASYRCRYVADWIGVKARWQLSMDESERVAVGRILDECRSR